MGEIKPKMELNIPEVNSRNLGVLHTEPDNKNDFITP